MVISSEIIFGAFLCMVFSQIPITTQANPNSPPDEDLQDEYYTVTPAMTDQFVPQDEKDAKAIHDSNKSKATIAGILSRREKVRRYAINIKMATFNGQVRWFSEIYYVPNHPFEDCCFSLIEKESTVLGNYLEYYMDSQDKRRIGIAMALIKDTHDMITTFDNHSARKFDGFLEKLGDPCKSLLKSWAKKNREPIEKDELNHESVTKDANTLNTERNNGNWKSTRTQLDSILFQKSIKYARAVIAEFEKLNNDKPIEDVILSCGLDLGLDNTYLIFAQYIKYKHDFIAGILFLNADGNDNWAIWNMCMAVIHPSEWPKIDEVFKQCSEGIPLTKFITEKADDKIMAEMMAAIIDPSFKPTKFKPAA